MTTIMYIKDHNIVHERKEGEYHFEATGSRNFGEEEEKKKNSKK
jgi:hypothetical protein